MYRSPPLHPSLLFYTPSTQPNATLSLKKMESSCEKTSAGSSSPCTSPPHSSSTNNNNSYSPVAIAATVAQPPQPAVIMSPCAACKILRRRCAEKCVLAPYFPPTDPLKFTIAHKVFGASNIIKLLQVIISLILILEFECLGALFKDHMKKIN